MPHILGVKVDNLTRQQALVRIGELIVGGGQHLVTTPNPEMLVAAQGDPEFRAALNRSSLALPDGFGLLLASRLLRIPFQERIAGSDFVWDIAALAARKGYSIYLLGAGEGVAQAAAEKLKLQNPKLKIVGAERGPQYDAAISRRRPVLTFARTSKSEDNPPQNKDPEILIIQDIRNAAPDILLVAFGHPRQEKWIAAHLSELPSVKIAMGVGGAFDFIAGRVKRAPRLLRLLGLEWLWRLLRQPWRITRIYRAVVGFPLLLLRQVLTSPRRRQRGHLLRRDGNRRG